MNTGCVSRVWPGTQGFCSCDKFVQLFVAFVSTTLSRLCPDLDSSLISASRCVVLIIQSWVKRGGGKQGPTGMLMSC